LATKTEIRMSADCGCCWIVIVPKRPKRLLLPRRRRERRRMRTRWLLLTPRREISLDGTLM
jgi:hypothetical protein